MTERMANPAVQVKAPMAIRFRIGHFMGVNIWAVGAIARLVPGGSPHADELPGAVDIGPGIASGSGTSVTSKP